jgi:hypothetical protein
MSFLQVGEVQAHRSVPNMTKYAGLAKNEQLHMPVGLPAGDCDVDNARHISDPELWMNLEAKIKSRNA